MPDYENIARTAGWISAPCYNGGPDMVRNPEYALNYLQSGAWESVTGNLEAVASQLASARKAAIEECAKVLDDAAQDLNRIRDPGMANNARSYANKLRKII